MISLRRLATFLMSASLAIYLGSALAAGSCPPPKTAVRSTAEAEALAVKAAEIYKLSPIPLKCVTYQSGDDGEAQGKSGPYWVAFSEHHTAECGGDPRTGPRLFTITVSRTGRMKTDAYGSDIATGKFRPLRCPK